jgi:hypothetical protein
MQKRDERRSLRVDTRVPFPPPQGYPDTVHPADMHPRERYVLVLRDNHAHYTMSDTFCISGVMTQIAEDAPFRGHYRAPVVFVGDRNLLFRIIPDGGYSVLYGGLVLSVHKDSPLLRDYFAKENKNALSLKRTINKWIKTSAIHE